MRKRRTRAAKGLPARQMTKSYLGAECEMLIRIWDLHRVKRDDKNHTVDEISWNAEAALVLRND
ncbi:hypothetical protein YC2023_103173 [Brassica napus]